MIKRGFKKTRKNIDRIYLFTKKEQNQKVTMVTLRISIKLIIPNPKAIKTEALRISSLGVRNWLNMSTLTIRAEYFFKYLKLPFPV